MTEKLNRHIYTVSKLSKDIKSLLEEAFPFIWVTGEISNYSVPGSGHSYFTLKDNNAVVNCVIFKNQKQKLKFDLENGIKIFGLARLSLYEPRGSYQLIFEHIEPEGAGSAQLAFEQLKKKLAANGFFDDINKKPIPFIPSKTCVVTSGTGAAVQDIINIAQRRFSNCRIEIFSVKVQGKNSKYEISKAIELVNNHQRADLIIIARGGGSLEDFASFNSELVANAIFNSKVPVITGIGHETDFTIADFVADLRAPTPSAAAELVVKNKEELTYRLKNYQIQLTQNIHYKLKSVMELFSRIRKSSVFLNPFDFINRKQQEIDYLEEGLTNKFKYLFVNKEKVFTSLMEKLNILNPLSVLARGYSITWKWPKNTILKNTKDVKIDDKIKVKLEQGEIICKIIQKT